jgi:hypothetical protein
MAEQCRFMFRFTKIQRRNTYFANSVVDTVDQNTVERSYVYLKTLDDYSGATDV